MSAIINNKSPHGTISWRRNPCLRRTHRLYQLHALGKVAHEGERADALGEPRDLAEAHHEAVLLGELVQGPALALVAVDELGLVLRGDEALQQLQEVQAQSCLVVPARRGPGQRRHPGSHDTGARPGFRVRTSRWRSRCRRRPLLPCAV